MLKISPTPEQAEALEKINYWLTTDDEYFSLQGYAGTGKTTILDFVVRNNSDLSVLVTATTNKAVKVLREKVTADNFSTIHSALNMRLKRSGTKEWFEPVDYRTPAIQLYDLVIVDECSMISKDLLGYIETVKKPGTKVLFSGDPAQLQPVGENNISESFNQKHMYLLESVVRYGTEIEKAASLVRNTSAKINPLSLINGKEIKLFDNSDLLHFKNFHSNIDNIRYLCFTNEKVLAANKALRNTHYGEPVGQPFLEGDFIVANSVAKLGQESIIMDNSEEGIVTHVKERPDAWELVVEKFFSNKETVQVRVVHEKYQKALDDKLQDLVDGRKWQEYYALKETYHDIRHCYAMTTHKSQGSTYNIVVIDFPDLLKCRDNKQLNQLIYVAMTRARQQVIFKV